MSELVLVTLPIGNNQDLTPRAKDVLTRVHKIVAEDTRVLREFCKHNAIDLSGKLIDSYHDHTGATKLAKFFGWLESEDVAIVSDAGSPIVSDPAFPLILEALNRDVKIATAPGVSAPIVALELSGLPPSPFHFHAFSPRDKGKKKEFFKLIGSQYGTHIFFEGVSRVEETMDMLSSLYPEENMSIGRELTKEYETCYRFKGKDWNQIKSEVVYKGEFVILVHNSQNTSNAISSDIIDMANDLIDNGIHPKKLSKLLAEITNRSNKDVYKQLQRDE